MTLRSRTAGACLATGTLLFAVADLLRRLVTPDGSATPTAVVRLVHDHLGTWTLAGALALASTFVLLPGLASVSGLAPARGRWLTRIGQGLFGAGVIASVAHTFGEFGLSAMQARAGLDPHTINALENAGFWPWDLAVLVFIAGFMLGPVLLLAGLRRARVVPVWSPVAALVAGACGGTGGVLAGWIGIAAWAAAFLPVMVFRARVHRSSTGVIGTPDRAEKLHESRTGVIQPRDAGLTSS